MAGRTDWKRWIAFCVLAAVPVIASHPRAAETSVEAAPPVVDPVERVRPRARPAGLGKTNTRCTADGLHCISLQSYIPDTCRVIEATAQEAGLNPDFFVRLIWRESLFDAAAVSPAGAQGIAQFMPGTARLRDLADPFNPAEALRASATYLAELRDHFGNLGFAAAAYNAGEARLESFLNRGKQLPPETRAYVPAITGYSATEWRDAPPAAPDFALKTAPGFREACELLGRERRLKQFHVPTVVMPWAAIVASHRSRDITAFRYRRALKLSATLRGQKISYLRMRLLGQPGRQWTAQIGTQSRSEADLICSRLQRDGVPCIVLKN